MKRSLTPWVGLALSLGLLIFYVNLELRVESLDQRTQSTMSVLKITRPGQPTIVFAQEAGEPWASVLRRAQEAMTGGPEGMPFEPKSTPWTGEGGVMYEVITYAKVGETMDEFCKRHEEEVREAQILFPPID
jgi:hypothetical protein